MPEPQSTYSLLNSTGTFTIKDGGLAAGAFSTRKAEKRTVWMPIVKEKVSGKYVAILSDNSTDRDFERISKNLIIKWAEQPFLPMLIDHENSVESYAGEWTNRKAIEGPDGNWALYAEAKFFSDKANPKAQQIKSMLDEGAELGTSIGAMVYEISETGQKEKGHEIRQWDDAELVEASWTPVPSNRNAFGFYAKSFNLTAETGEKTEVPTMAETEEKNAAGTAEELNKLKTELESERKKTEELHKELERAKSLPKKSADEEATDEDLQNKFSGKTSLEIIGQLRGIPLSEE